MQAETVATNVVRMTTVENDMKKRGIEHFSTTPTVKDVIMVTYGRVCCYYVFEGSTLKEVVYD
jgi:hypothetical protein